MKKLFLVSLLVSHSHLSAGFIAGTLVKIQSGHIPIEEVKEGDKVVAFKSNNVLGYSRNSYPTPKYVHALTKITIEDESLYVTQDQQFVLPTQKDVQAINLKAGDFIMSISGPLKIDNVEHDEVENHGPENGIGVCTLFVEDIGIFFVSKHDLVVFNSPYDVFRSVKKGVDNAARTLFYELPKITLKFLFWVLMGQV